jgi:2,5-diamino-6-(ribosylamino)-4(3H)-pyrimidinone 5'-phosphate reductase
MSERSPREVRPEVWVNCAASADGRIAFAEGARARLSSAEDLRRVQAMRADVDGILVGVGTVLLDDPSLRVHWDLLGRAPGAEPTRIVVDGSGRTPEGARVLDGSIPTIVGVSERCHRRFPAHVRTIVAGSARVDLGLLFVRLAELGVRRLLVEGGSEILASVLGAGLFDRFTVYYAPVLIGDGTAPSIVAGRAARSFDDVRGLELRGIERSGEGYVATYVPRRAPGPAPPGPPDRTAPFEP